MKDLKVFIDSKRRLDGWISVKSFSDFANLLSTVRLKEMSVISFSNQLEDDDEDPLGGFSGVDCAVKLIEIASGEPLPNCLIHDDSEDIREILNHYTTSYKYDNLCIEHFIQ